MNQKHERACLALASTAVFLILCSIYLLTHGGNFFITDGVVMFRTTEAIVERHTLVLEPEPALSQIVPGKEGQHYSKYGVGQPLAAVIPYQLARITHPVAFSYMWHKAVENYFVSLFNQVVTAATGALLVLLAYRLSNGLRLSVGLALTWGLCTLAWPYAKTFFSEPLFTFCLVLASLGLLAYQQTAKSSRLAWLTVAGCALGYAVLVRVAGLTLVPAFLAYFVWAAGQHREGALVRQRGGGEISWGEGLRRSAPAALAFGLPLLMSFVVVVWHNLVRFGSLFDEGYAMTEEGFTTPLWTGLAGVLLSPGKSLFLYVPLAALAVVGWRYLWREQRATAALWSGLFAITLLQTALWWAWWGGWSWGPRLLVPLLPFLILSLGPLLRASRAARLAFVPLALGGFLIALLGVLVDFNPYLSELMAEHPGERIGTEDPGIYFDPALSPIIAHARFLSNGEHGSVITFDLERLGFSTGFKHMFWLVTGVLFLAGVSLLAYADRLYSPRRRGSGPVSRAEPAIYTS